MAWASGCGVQGMPGRIVRTMGSNHSAWTNQSEDYRKISYLNSEVWIFNSMRRIISGVDGITTNLDAAMFRLRRLCPKPKDIDQKREDDDWQVPDPAEEYFFWFRRVQALVRKTRKVADLYSRPPTSYEIKKDDLLRDLDLIIDIWPLGRQRIRARFQEVMKALDTFVWMHQVLAQAVEQTL